MGDGGSGRCEIIEEVLCVAPPSTLRAPPPLRFFEIAETGRGGLGGLKIQCDSIIAVAQSCGAGAVFEDVALVTAAA